MHPIYRPLGLALLGLALFVVPLAASSPPTPSPLAPQLLRQQARLHPTLLRTLLANPDSAEFLPIIVQWRRDTEAVVAQAALAPDRLTRRQQVVESLQQDATHHSAALQTAVQAATQAGLARNPRAFWVSPVMALEAQPTLIAALSSRDDVVQVRLDESFHLPPFDPTAETAAATAPSPTQIPWHLQMVQAELTEQALGLNGSGVVVAVIDSGVDWQHPTLLTKYRGYNPKGPALHAGNWYAVTQEGYIYPGDGYGHGTHVAGTVLGDDGAGNRIGVATGARWIGVKAFNNAGITFESWLHAALEWVIAPEGNPALAPDVINCSWGSRASADERFRPDIAAIRAAGILPIFSAGNSGPRAGSIESPSSFPEALAVAALDAERVVTSFSSRGPSPWHEVKPEIAAPGAGIRSAIPGGGYLIANGTSMAAPHVTGIAAMLLQANPNLSPNQLELLLTRTATPLGSRIPNNDSGWGLVNAYAAALQVTASGELVAQVVRADGATISQPRLTVTPRSGDAPITLLGNPAGTVSVALRPGLYDLQASAFGFHPGSHSGVNIPPRSRVQTQITLTLQPAGSLFGRVVDQVSGAPLGASITVSDTPLQVQSDPNNGTYSLVLPAGRWTMRTAAPGHRIRRTVVTVLAGRGEELNLPLPPAPRILLVDSGRWYYESRIDYYTDLLERLDYPVTLWPVRNPFGSVEGPQDSPSAALLTAYDTVIWSSPFDSPGFVGADEAIGAFLEQGGHLLLSGQDVAYWDAGGSFNVSTYFPNYLGGWYSNETYISRLQGSDRSPLAGITLTLNTADSAAQQFNPDALIIADTKSTHPLMNWPNGQIGATTSGTCRPYRAAWLGFGLEGSGPIAARDEALQRLLDWFEAPSPLLGLQVQTTEETAVSPKGTEVVHSIVLDSTGVQHDLYNVSLSGSSWPMRLSLADGKPLALNGPIALNGCQKLEILAVVTIPAEIAAGSQALHTLRFTSRTDPSLAPSVTLVTKTPATVLLVDDQLFYDYALRYAAALDRLAIPYDRHRTQNDRSPPSLEKLSHYPLVIWFTGYNWFSPLAPSSQERLTAYLEGGGRLLLSSQDLLDVHGVTPFVRDYLGVIRASLTVSSTDLLAQPTTFLAQGAVPLALDFPFANWSDGLTGSSQSQPLLVDQNLQTVALSRAGPQWRTAFFAFPLEALQSADLATVLGRTLTWLSPFGGSRLETVPLAAAGSQIPVTLTLTNGDQLPLTAARALLPLPPATTLVPESLTGSWRYQSPQHALAWEGRLDPGTAVTLGARLQLPQAMVDQSLVDLQAHLIAGTGLTVTAAAHLPVNAPLLYVESRVEPPQVGPGESARFSIDFGNRGLLATEVRLTAYLPQGLTVVGSTVSASEGTVQRVEDELVWSGTLAAGQQLQLRFTGIASLPAPAGRLIIRIDLSALQGQRQLTHSLLSVPLEVYMPASYG